MRLVRRTWRPFWREAGAVLVIWIVIAGDVLAQPVASERVVAHIGVGWRPASRTFAGSTPFRLFLEEGTLQTDYRIQGGGILGGGISFRLWRNLALGVDVSSYRAIHPAAIDAQVPHPLFFDYPRRISGVVGGLERRERAGHLRGIWVTQLTDWLSISFSGGPSVIDATQEFVTALEYVENEFPYTDLHFAGHSIDAQSGKTAAINGGIGVDLLNLHRLGFLRRYEIMEHIGFGVMARYVRGSMDMEVGDRGTLNVDLGGLQLTTGLRFRF